MNPFAINAYTSKGEVVFSYRSASGELRYKGFPAEYTGFVRELPEALLRDQRCLGYRQEGEWYRLLFRGYEERKSLLYEHSNITVYEADVSPSRRIMADENIDIQAPRRGYFDIETDSRVPFSRKEETRLLCWALVDSSGKAITGMLTANTDAAEKCLLEKLFASLESFDQLAAWNMDGFDGPVIEARAKYHKLWIDRRILWIDHMQAYKRMNLQTAESGEEKQSFSLDAVAQAKLGDSKEEIPDFVAKRWPGRSLGSLAWQLWEAGGEYRELLERYMVKDAALMPRIEEKTGYLAAHQTICEECHIFPNSHALKPTAQADGWLLRYARLRGEHLPSKIERDEQPQFEGAYVMPPKATGILKDVYVVDFAGLYPSIIRSWGISHDTKSAEGTCIAPTTGVKFRTDIQGLIPSALAEWAKLRAGPKAQMKKATPQSEEWHRYNRLQNVFKVLQNSLYGLLGSIYSRYYDPDLARSVTLIGVWLLKIVIEEAEKQGMTAVYADTDGCYLMNTTYDQVVAFTKYINDVILPAKLSEQGCVVNVVKLDFQEAFSRIVFPMGEQPAAKRFCGRFSYYDGKPVTDLAVEVKGLEVKRGDSARLARRMQQEVIDALMSAEEDPQIFEDLVLRWRHRITLESLDIADISISKSVKDLSEYKIRRRKDGSTMSPPAHVVIAKRMMELGEDVSSGTRVRYVVTDADVSPMEIVSVDEFTGDFDRRHMWNKVVYPASMRLLAGAFATRNWQHHIIKKPKKPLAGQLGLGL